jgi:putative membrane protein
LRPPRQAAEAAFCQEAVHATTARTGLLVYVSILEERVELLPDQGLLGKIPGAVWNDLAVQADTLEHLLAGLERVGTVLAQHVPSTGDSVNELSNAPRMRAE